MQAAIQEACDEQRQGTLPNVTLYHELQTGSAQPVTELSSPIDMFVPPAPILAPFPRSKPSVLPIAALAALFHQPMAISAIFIFIPFVPITAVAIVITVMFFRKTDHRPKK